MARLAHISISFNALHLKRNKIRWMCVGDTTLLLASKLVDRVSKPSSTKLVKYPQEILSFSLNITQLLFLTSIWIVEVRNKVAVKYVNFDIETFSLLLHCLCLDHLFQKVISQIVYSFHTVSAILAGGFRPCNDGKAFIYKGSNTFSIHIFTFEFL